MAKTRYGQRMYRARAERAQEMQVEGAEEYTVNARSGSSILVEESARPDNVYVTFLQDGSPMGGGTSKPYSAAAIKDEYGVDIMKGKLISGATTEGYSGALAAMNTTGSTLFEQIHVSEYLQGDRDVSSFNSFDRAAIQRAEAYMRSEPNSEGSQLLSALVGAIEFDRALRRS